MQVGPCCVGADPAAADRGRGAARGGGKGWGARGGGLGARPWSGRRAPFPGPAARPSSQRPPRRHAKFPPLHVQGLRQGAPAGPPPVPPAPQAPRRSHAASPAALRHRRRQQHRSPSRAVGSARKLLAGVWLLAGPQGAELLNPLLGQPGLPQSSQLPRGSKPLHRFRWKPVHGWGVQRP